MFDFQYMQIALEQAKLAFDADEVPVGAALVVDGKLISVAHNLSMQTGVAHHHAELIVIEKAAELFSTDIRHAKTELYVTLEPCPMCAQAISLSHIDYLYYGAADPKSGGVEHGPRIFESSSCHYRPEIYGSIMENESATLLQNFFKSRRL